MLIVELNPDNQTAKKAKKLISPILSGLVYFLF